MQIGIMIAKLKVLWFSNTPANSDEYFNKQLAGTGGWLKSLDKAIQNRVELHVVFYHNDNINNFIYESTYYYPIPKHKNILSRLRGRIFNEIIYKEHLYIYLDLIKSIDPDIIHIHGTEGPFSSILGQTYIPVAVSLQGIITVISHKYCSGIDKKFLKIKNTSFQNMSSILFPSSFKSSMSRFIKRHKREIMNLKHCKYVIGRTEWDKRISRILAPESQYFHSNEILRDSFYRVAWENNRGHKLILHTTTSNSFYKGFETVCLALHEINKLGIDIEWRIAGINKNDLIVKVVQKKIRDKFPRKNLVLLGRFSAQELIRLMLQADIYVMPSHIENSPNTLCEAMILGMPCITTFVGGTGSLLKDGQEGVLIQDGDPWAMAGAVLDLKNDPEKAAYLGKNARERALKRHEKDSVVNGLIDIYQTICRGCSVRMEKQAKS